MANITKTYEKNEVTKNYIGMGDVETCDIVDDVTELGATVRIEPNGVVVIASQTEHDRLQSLGYVLV